MPHRACTTVAALAAAVALAACSENPETTGARENLGDSAVLPAADIDRVLAASQAIDGFCGAGEGERPDISAAVEGLEAVLQENPPDSLFEFGGSDRARPLGEVAGEAVDELEGCGGERLAAPLRQRLEEARG